MASFRPGRAEPDLAGPDSPRQFACHGHFSALGVSFFASSGDTGGAVEYPSSSPNVISVGGTTLHFDSTGAFSGETAWSSGGGGCSAYETATSAQQSGSTTLCGTRRGTPDVSLDADPASGVSVYDSTSYQSQSGWWQVVVRAPRLRCGPLGRTMPERS